MSALDGLKTWTNEYLARQLILSGSLIGEEAARRLTGMSQPENHLHAGLVEQVARLERERDQIEAYEPRILLDSTPIDQKIIVAHEIMQNMVIALDAACGPNYSETKATLQVKKAGEYDPEFIVTVQRRGGKTPHEMRKEAEAQRDAAIRALQDAANTANAARFHPQESDHVQWALKEIGGMYDILSSPKPASGEGKTDAWRDPEGNPTCSKCLHYRTSGKGRWVWDTSREKWFHLCAPRMADAGGGEKPWDGDMFGMGPGVIPPII